MAQATEAETQRETKTLVHFEVDGGVAVLTLDDPPANTYTYEMMRQLDDGILRARMRDDVHVIVITGKGDKFFSAGANIQMLNEVTAGFKYCFCLHANETLQRLEREGVLDPALERVPVGSIDDHRVGRAGETEPGCRGDDGGHLVGHPLHLLGEELGVIGLSERVGPGETTGQTTTGRPGEGHSSTIRYRFRTTSVKYLIAVKRMMTAARASAVGIM